MDTADGAKVPDYPEPQIFKPTQVTGASNSVLRIWVCQASYGDTLALEIDPTPPKGAFGQDYYEASMKSKSRSVILIDGGPAKISPTGQNFNVRLPINDLYAMLRELLPYYSNKMDTLVVTHDDEDHILGIADLLRRLLNEKSNWDAWPRGALSMKEKRSPFANVWHNSADTIVSLYKLGDPDGKSKNPLKNDTKQKNSKTKPVPSRAPGYFDSALEQLRVKLGTTGKVPKFNTEFLPQDQSKLKGTVRKGFETYRGHAHFQFLGPGRKELDGLASFFKKHNSTQASLRQLTKQDLIFGLRSEDPNDFGSSAVMLTKTKNDQSKKNLASIVFLISANFGATTWHGLFTGDASACTIFKDIWDGKPIDYDLIKIGHHGSAYNNFFGTKMINDAKKKTGYNPKNGAKTIGEVKRDRPFFPGDASLAQIMPDLKQTKDKEYLSLSNVLAYFCNVRAKQYVISASHDEHPNPHISTLIALTTRAMLYPEPDGPIRVFLTNPISSLSWQQFFSYWLKINPEKDKKPGNNKKKSLYDAPMFDDPEVMARLEYLCKQKPKDDRSLDNLGYTAIKDLTKLSYDYTGRFYQFYCLRTTDSFSSITAGPGNPLDIRQANWMLIEPHDILNVMYMSTRYNEKLVARLGKKTSVDAMPTNRGRMLAKNDSDGEILAKRQAGTSRYPSPDDDIYVGKKLKITPVFGKSIPNPNFQPDGGKKKPAENKKSRKIKNIANNFMMAQMPSVSQRNSAGRAPLTSFAMQQTMRNNVSTLNLNSETVFQILKAPTTSREDARRPNRDAFRKFDVDDFELPMGDDFFGMIETPIKHVGTFQELLIYLVRNNSLRLNEAINASTHACLEGDPRLGAIMYLLLGGEEAEKVLRTLPVSYANDVSVLDNETWNPLLWPVQFVDAAVVDIDVQGQALQDASGIQQFTIRIYPTSNEQAYTWKVPNRAALLGKGRFDIHVLNYIELTTYWPTDDKRRTVHGTFAGSLPAGSNKPEQPIICEWLMLPSEDRPIVYHMQFANSDYEIDDCSLKILDMIAVFDGVSVDLALAAVDALLPGLVDTTNPLGEHLVLNKPGFTLSRDHLNSRDLRLHGIFGTFSLVDVPDWKPFGGYDGKPGLEGFLSTIQIPTPSLRLSMQDFFSERGARFFFQLSHSVKLGATQLQYEVESRPSSSRSRLYEFTFRPVDNATQAPLSVMDLLSSFGLAALSQGEVPDALWNALNSVSLTCFRFGWRNEMGLRSPDFLEFAIRIEDLNIADGLLDLDDIFLRVRIDNPGNKELRNIYIRSGGTYQLAGVKHLMTLTYGNDPLLAPSARGSDGTSSFGPMDLAIRCTDTPLTLGKILDHFWPGTDIIPAPFDVVTETVGLSRFQITTGYDEAKKKQELQLINIGLGVAQHDIEIIEGLFLVDPEMLITVYFPFDQSLRTFVISFSAVVMIEDYSLLVDVGLKTGEAGRFWVTLRAGGEGFPVGAFLRFASRKIGTLNIDYPENFGPLDSTYIDELSILVGKGDGSKLSILGFSIDAYSDVSLPLWDSPQLSVENVALSANYQAKSGFNFDFGAELKVNEHLIRVSVGYQELRTSNQTDTSNVASKDKGWFIEANYPDDIDLLALVSKLTRLEISSNISQTQLPNTSTPSGGVILKDLTIRLQKDNVGGALYISADTTWKPFKHLEFAATYEGAAGWGFCLSMSLEDKLLSLIPVDFIKDIGEYVEFNKTIVALYVNKVNTHQAGLTRNDLPPAPGSGPVPSAGGFGLAVSTQVRLTDKCGLIRKWLGNGELDIVGDISTQGVGLGVKIGKVELLKNETTGKYDLEIDGRFDLRANQKGLQVGLIADMRINCPKVTTDVIMVEQAGFIVQLADAGIGFQGAVKGTLRNLFEIEGLEARGLSVIGVFSLAESGVPEELGFTGELGLKDMGGIKGRLAFYYAQRDIIKCYFSGKLEKVDMEAIIRFFLKKQGLPDIAGQFLQGNVVINTLELEAALSNMYVKQLDLHVQQGFFYEASLYARAGSFEWSGYTCIEVRPGAF